jgi:hypothetical protein
MKTKILSILFIATLFSFSSCELFDEHKPPAISFKTGTDYTSEDATVAKGATIKVGIIADKKEDDMKTYNISYSYDAATTTTTQETFTLAGSEEQHYEKDYEFTTRNESGTEKWYFTITDRDGNIAKLSLTLTVN